MVWITLLRVDSTILCVDFHSKRSDPWYDSQKNGFPLLYTFREYCPGSNHPRSVWITSVDGYTKQLFNQTTSYRMSSLRIKPHAGWPQENPCAQSWRTLLQNQMYPRGSYHTWEPGKLTSGSNIPIGSREYSLIDYARNFSLFSPANLKQRGITCSDLCLCHQIQTHEHCNVTGPVNSQIELDNPQLVRDLLHQLPSLICWTYEIIISLVIHVYLYFVKKYHSVTILECECPFFF